MIRRSPTPSRGSRTCSNRSAAARAIRMRRSPRFTSRVASCRIAGSPRRTIDRRRSNWSRVSTASRTTCRCCTRRRRASTGIATNWRARKPTSRSNRRSRRRKNTSRCGRNSGARVRAANASRERSSALRGRPNCVGRRCSMPRTRCVAAWRISTRRVTRSTNNCCTACTTASASSRRKSTRAIWRAQPVSRARPSACCTVFLPAPRSTFRATSSRCRRACRN